ncbi:MAG: VTT domain-containing protein [Bacteroidota bacterium]|nr:VTT domain-containing protein [Bacteroidota bacterium]
MQDQIIHFFQQYPHIAILASLLISIVIAVLGVVPSVFITGANILFFGFWKGTLISFLGETIGAAIAFLLYRKGFKSKIRKGLQKFPKLKRLIEAEGKQAFILILSLRLLPFVPSGLVTFAAAIGKVSAITFLIASSLGKIPALIIEAYSVYQVTQFGWQGKLILALISCVLIYFVIKKIFINGKRTIHSFRNFLYFFNS